MILNIITFYNNKVGCFTNPHYTDLEPDKAAVQLSRLIQLNPIKSLTYQDLTMFYLGIFNDETGEITLKKEPVKLLDCDKILNDSLNSVMEVLKNDLAKKSEEID